MAQIKWNWTGQNEKIAVAELCGWSNRTAKRLSKQKWSELTSAARNVLTRHGIIAGEAI